jgi:hypothetical protein
MDEIWNRIDAELKRRRKDWQWLYTALGYDRQRVNNWSRRGVPAKEHAAIAEALGVSVDWISRGIATSTGDDEVIGFSRTATEPRPLFTDATPSVTTSIRAPVIAWARLGVDLKTQNDRMRADAYVSVPDGASDTCKWVDVVDDYPSFRIRRGMKVAIDPDLSKHKFADGDLYLFRRLGDKFFIAEYRSLAGGSFEAIPSDGYPMDKERHGLTVEGVIRGTWK